LRTLRLRSSVQMGVVALMTAAMLEGTVRSPMAKKTKGMALLKRATRRSQPRSRRGGSVRRRARSTVQRKAAPKAVRMSATQGGGKLWTVRLMRRNDAPQMAESSNSSRTSRSFIWASLAAAGILYKFDALG
jgi:hypothetical protein